MVVRQNTPPPPDFTSDLPPIVNVFTPTDINPNSNNSGGIHSNNASNNKSEVVDEKLSQLASIAALLQSHLSIQDRTYKLEHYPSCFIGSEAVDLLLQNGIVESRLIAVDALQALMTGYPNDGGDTGVLFEHVIQEKRGMPFEDDYQFYHFLRDADQNNAECEREGEESDDVMDINFGDGNNKDDSSQMDDLPHQPMTDKYGFLIDDKRRRLSKDTDSLLSEGGGEGDVGDTAIDEEKWGELLDKAESTSKISTKVHDKIKLFTRKGLPDSIRQRAWTVCTGVDQIMKQSRGQYEMLLKQADFEWMRWNRRTSVDAPSLSDMSGLTDPGFDSQLAEYKNKIPVHTILEQIERDIERTFPNHYLFKTVPKDEGRLERTGGEEDEEEVSGGEISQVTDDDEIEPSGGEGTVADDIRRQLNEMVEMMKLTNVNGGKGNSDASATVSRSNSAVTPSSSRLSEMGDGQGALRRVLRAYSQYDSEVGYCQGMNFIVAMFLTFLPEEESFWLLVIVMNEEPYKLRELFKEDMSGTHEILYISDKLMKQFVPKLWKHLEREGIHNSMFVTQWLLTLYTSSFPFDLVSRVWDSFLIEGWKVIYRVMLSLLKHAEGTLLEMPFEGILMFLRDFPTMINGQNIMQTSLKIGLKTKHIQKYVREWRIANPSEDGPSRIISGLDSRSECSLSRESPPDASKMAKKGKGGGKFSIPKIGFKKMGEREMIIEDLAPKLLPVAGSVKFAVLIHNALTPAECKQMIDRAEKGGFEDASVYDRRSNQIHRNCKRWYEDDPTLAEEWYERILKALDDSALEYKIRNAPWMSTRHNALPIRSVGLNERLRVLKYNQGEYFGSHCDSKFVRGPDYGNRAGETSFVSVQVYLNDKFKGGQTRFLGAGRHYDVKPRTGSILIFDHNLLHRGEALKAGKKYVVRTDVMYRVMRTRGDEMSVLSASFPEVIGVNNRAHHGGLGFRQAL